VGLSIDQKRLAIDPSHQSISIRRQCELLSLNRSSWYSCRWQEAAIESDENLALMRLIDEQYTKTPFYGSRRMNAWLKSIGHAVNRKRVQRLMRQMGLQGVGPKPGTSQRNKEHKVYPYLLRDYVISKPNQVWSTDITYVAMPAGFMYLVAVIDWFSRYVLSWELSNTLETSFCITALKGALKHGTPDIFNTDQGSQFTSVEFLKPLKDLNIRISMDGKGRALDNVFVERLWRSVKYECLYIQEFTQVPELYTILNTYFKFYNEERLHQSLGYKTPSLIHRV
jgi:putative transposase